MHPPRAEVDRSRRRRAALASCALHASALAVMVAAVPASAPSVASQMPALTGAVAAATSLEVDLMGPDMDVRSAPIAIDAGGRSARTPAFRARVRPVASAVAAARPAVVAAASVDVPPKVAGDVAVEATTTEAPAESGVTTAAAPTLAAANAASAGDDAERVGEFDDGSGLGKSAARGLGDGDGAGTGGGRLRRDLRARVIGAPAREATSPEGAPFISNREATALRVRDYFPRLPETQWPRRDPYLVTLDVCVSAQGTVNKVALRSSASPALDANVVAAVTTWRYHPRLVAGAATPFCHGVIIKYERW